MYCIISYFFVSVVLGNIFIGFIFLNINSSYSSFPFVFLDSDFDFLPPPPKINNL